MIRGGVSVVILNYGECFFVLGMDESYGEERVIIVVCLRNTVSASGVELLRFFVYISLTPMRRTEM